MKKIAIYVAVVAAMLTASCAKTQQAAKEADDAVKESVEATAQAAEQTVAFVDDQIQSVEGGVIDLADDNAYRQNSKVRVLTVLDFNATWCGPCKMLAPVFDATAKKYDGKVRFVSVDVDKCPLTAENFGVRAVPTVVLMKPDGTSVRFEGTNELLPAEKFEAIVNANL